MEVNSMDNTEMISKNQDTNKLYHKILVAVDYQDVTPEVFDTAILLAKTYASELRIVYSLPKPIIPYAENFIYGNLSGYGATYSPDLIALEEQITAEMQGELQTWLSGLVNLAQAHNITAKADYYIGDPGQNICQAAQEDKIDLIVIGRHGRSGLSELILGSVSNYVVHHAPCSVLVVQITR
jgi:nucleotide-binding universal stress UspA family protein